MKERAPLTEVQKYRLGDAAQAAVDAQMESFRWLIDNTSVRNDYQGVELAHQAGVQNGAFYRLLHRRGLAVGDTVRVLTNGPYKGAVAEIHDFDYANRAELRIDNVTVLANPAEAELVNPAPGGGG